MADPKSLSEALKQKQDIKPSVDLDAIAEKVLQQQAASTKATKQPRFYSAITFSRSGFMLGDEIFRPDIHGRFFPKTKEQEEFCEAKVLTGIFNKFGE